MMLESWRLQNFKAFVDSGPVSLAPLTIMAGPNSGGKSSLLQSILLLKQSLENKDPLSLIDIDGRYVSALRFSDLVFGKPPKGVGAISYGFTMKTPIPAKVAARYFCTEGNEDNADEEGKTLWMLSSIELALKEKVFEEGKGRTIGVTKFSMRNKCEDLPGPELKIEYVQGQYKLTLRGSGVDLPLKGSDERVVGVVFRNFIPVAALVGAGDEGSRTLEPSYRTLSLPPVFRVPLGRLTAYLEDRVHYLGPLREEPHHAYLRSGLPPQEIGSKGENAAQVLWLEQNRVVQYATSLNGRNKEAALIDAVADCFHDLGLTQSLNVSSVKSLIYQVLFAIRDRRGRARQVTIAEVGFGISQLLPVVLACLRAEAGDLVLLEQPEIHLHPRLQANLADLLLGMAVRGRRFIVETHSDHLINRLRRRIAEETEPAGKELLQILFVGSGAAGQGSNLDSLRVDSMGQIENWPAGFLAESVDEAEAIFRAGLDKRRKER